MRFLWRRVGRTADSDEGVDDHDYGVGGGGGGAGDFKDSAAKRVSLAWQVFFCPPSPIGTLSARCKVYSFRSPRPTLDTALFAFLVLEAGERGRRR